MEIRFEHSPKETKCMGTDELRTAFLVGSLMEDDAIKLTYTHYDRVIIGGIVPVTKTLILETEAELRADFFFERREAGIINIGGKGKIIIDGVTFEISKLDCLYIGKGQQKISFESVDQANPARFYLLSAPAHAAYPTSICFKEQAMPVTIGSINTSNERTIYKYIHAEGIRSCQLVMGLTILNTGSVWNTMPAHTHTRRMEAYFYFDLDEQQRVMHFMGEPSETRHLVVANQEAVISPPWSIHSGCGTSNYAFIWGMAGENYNYTDMDPAPAASLK